MVKFIMGVLFKKESARLQAWEKKLIEEDRLNVLMTLRVELKKEEKKTRLLEDTAEKLRALLERTEFSAGAEQNCPICDAVKPWDEKSEGPWDPNNEGWGGPTKGHESDCALSLALTPPPGSSKYPADNGPED